MAGRWWRRWFDRLFQVDRKDWAVLRPLLLVGYFESYDSSLLSIGASTISVGLGVSASSFAIAAAFIRLAGLSATFVVREADRIGRRTLLLISLAGFTVTTALTSLAWGLVSFTIFSAGMRIFLGTENTVATVTISEEVRSDRRGNALAVLGALSGLGAGTLAFLIPFANSSSLNWRVLYLWPLVLIPIVAWLRRSLHETEAFKAAKAGERIQRSYWPTIEPRFRPWIARLVSVQFLYGAAQTAGLFFASHLATVTYGWLGVYSLILIGAAPFGALGFIVGGRFSDRIGRRPALAIGLVSLGVGLIAIFLGGRWAFAPGYWIIVFANSAVWPVLGAYMAELFPTEVRSTFHSFIYSFQTIGAAFGLLVAGAVTTQTEVDYVMVVAALAVAASALLLRRIPETTGTSAIDPKAL